MQINTKNFFSILYTSPMNNCKIKPENSVIHSRNKKHKIPINLRKMSKTSTIKKYFPITGQNFKALNK